MVLSMSNTNQPHLPQRITVTMKFNFNSIFYVRYKSEEISPGVDDLVNIGLKFFLPIRLLLEVSVARAWYSWL